MFRVFYELHGQDNQQKILLINLKNTDLLSREELILISQKCLHIFPQIATRFYKQIYIEK